MRSKKKITRTPDRSAQPQYKNRALSVNRYRNSSSSPDGSDPVGRRTRQTHAASVRSFARFVVQWGGFVVVVLVLVANTLLTSARARVVVSGDSAIQLRSQEDYQKSVADAFSTSIFHRSKFLLRPAAFEQYVVDSLPEISHATAVVPLAGTKLQVNLVIPEVIARLKHDAAVGIVGSNGVLLAGAVSRDVERAYLELPTLVLDPAIPVEPGERFMTATDIQLVTLLQEEFDGSTTYRPLIKQISYSVVARAITVEFIGTGLQAKLTTERDAREQVGALVATWRQLRRSGSELKVAEYIDVRVDGRVFVR